MFTALAWSITFWCLFFMSKLCLVWRVVFNNSIACIVVCLFLLALWLSYCHFILFGIGKWCSANFETCLSNLQWTTKDRLIATDKYYMQNLISFNLLSHLISVIRIGLIKTQHFSWLWGLSEWTNMIKNKVGVDYDLISILRMNRELSTKVEAIENRSELVLAAHPRDTTIVGSPISFYGTLHYSQC